MSSEMLLIVFILTAAMLSVLIAKLTSFWRGFAENTRHICYMMDRADSYNEYRKWRGELRCHYLMLIPFVTEKNVMRLYDRIYHKADRAKEEERKDSIAPLLMPSILGICLCLVCVCGMTWAWYSASVETPTQKLTGAYYEVKVEKVEEIKKVETVMDGDDEVETVMDGDGEVHPDADGGYELKAGYTYRVTLLASGSVKECGGYCLIECGDTGKYYTKTFKPEDTITITLRPETDGKYTFTGVWGSVPSEIAEDAIIKE